MSPQKPRPYSGPVDWLDEAREHAASGWDDRVLAAVLDHWPYDPNPTGVRRADWVELVAHVSLRRDEDPIQTAERLALYVSTYRERYQKTLTPVQVKETQADAAT